MKLLLILLVIVAPATWAQAQTIPIVTSPQGSVSLVQDSVAQRWTGLVVVVISPIRVFGLAEGISFDRVIQPGTLTILFPRPVPVVFATVRGSVLPQPTMPFALGAGSP